MRSSAQGRQGVVGNPPTSGQWRHVETQAQEGPGSQEKSTSGLLHETVPTVQGWFIC